MLFSQFSPRGSCRATSWPSEWAPSRRILPSTWARVWLLWLLWHRSGPPVRVVLEVCAHYVCIRALSTCHLPCSSVVLLLSCRLLGLPGFLLLPCGVHFGWSGSLCQVVTLSEAPGHTGRGPAMCQLGRRRRGGRRRGACLSLKALPEASLSLLVTSSVCRGQNAVTQNAVATGVLWWWDAGAVLPGAHSTRPHRRVPALPCPGLGPTCPRRVPVLLRKGSETLLPPLGTLQRMWFPGGQLTWSRPGVGG